MILFFFIFFPFFRGFGRVRIKGQFGIDKGYNKHTTKKQSMKDGAHDAGPLEKLGINASNNAWTDD